jgi:hypothetical protein
MVELYLHSPIRLHYIIKYTDNFIFIVYLTTPPVTQTVQRQMRDDNGLEMASERK